MKKKALSILMASLMVVTSAACGGSTSSSTQNASTAASSTETAASTQATSAEKSGSKTSSSEAAPTEYEEATLSAFIQQSVTGESGEWVGWGAKKLYDDVKLKIDFDPTGDEIDQKLQQYLVAGELPDIVGFRSLDAAQKAMDADMLLPMDEYADQIPNIFANDFYTDAVNYSKDFTSNGTGHLYIMPVAVGPSGYNSLNWTPLLQWDAYKNVGFPQIGTLEDYLDVVADMVAYKPATDTGEKVYGFSLFSDWDQVTALEISTLSFFYGIDTEYVSPLMETDITTGKTKSLLSDDSFYKRALKFYYEANQRGLLDPDSMTQTYDEVSQKLSAGRVMFSWFSWLTGSYNDRSNTDNAEKVDGLTAVVADDMKLYKAPDQTIGRSWYLAISKNCKNVEAATRLMNWLYDEEVCAYLSNGPQGLTWDYVNGEPQVIDWTYMDSNADPLMPEDVGGGAFRDGVYAFNTLGIQAATVMDNGYTIGYRYWPTTLSRNPTLMAQEAAEKVRNGHLVLEDYLAEGGKIAKSTQAVNMIAPADDDLQLIITQIGEIVKKNSWQMVYAKDEAEFEKLWSEMVEQAGGLGLDQVTSYYTEQWSQALETVKKYE